MSEHEIETSVKAAIDELWRVNQGLVPDRRGAAARTRLIGKVLIGLAVPLAVAWVPAALLARYWVPLALPPPDEAVGFAIGLVQFVAPLLIAVIYWSGTIILRRAQRLEAPFDVSREVRGRQPLWGRFVRRLSRLLTRRGLTVFTLQSLILMLVFTVITDDARARSDGLTAMISEWIRLVLMIGVGLAYMTRSLLAFLPWGVVDRLERVAQRIDVTGQRLLRPSADAVRSTDRRKPIVLLRSFRDDEVTVGDERGNARLEEVLAQDLPRVGPLVAIGQPGESLSDLGAARNYYSDADWRSAISEWIEEALIVVVLAGRTSGLLWEMETIARLGHTSKLIVMMPPDDRARRWNNLVGALPALTDQPGQIPSMPKGLLCLYGGSSGDLTMISADGTSSYHYRRSLYYALYAILCQNGGQKPARAR